MQIALGSNIFEWKLNLLTYLKITNEEGLHEDIIVSLFCLTT